ncbi:FecR domain-containing protein, partial [Candidatus Woesearchaeota archaeon]|nr:FecR domain-containing protein [Candidatus Woesearchaeota archaeon]
MAKRGVIVFLVLGILIFSSVVFVSAQEPGAGFSALDFVDAAISKEEITYTYSWGSFDHNLLDDLYYQCVGREIYYNGKGACDRFKVKDVYGRPADSTAASNQCFDICDYRHGMASILPNLILCEHVVAKAKENRLIDITTSTRGVYDIEHDLSSDFERNRKDDNSVTPGYAYNLVSSNYQNYLSQFPGAGEQDDMGRAAYFLAVIQKQDACNKELAKISEEELNSLYAEDEPTVGVPIPTDQKTSENGNYEKGGTLKEWKERLQSETGADSKQSKTAAACDALMKQKTAECSKHGGWKTDYMMEITDFRTDEHYEFQDIRNGGCPPTSPTGDTTYLDSQAEGGESAYQVVCSVLCSSWSCGEPKAETVGTKIGGIGNLKGKVEVMQPDDSWKEVKSGTDIHLNDNIRTGENGKAVIKLADDTLFTLGHDSQFTVGDSKTESKLDFGRLKAKIKCLINTVDCFPVRFTNAVASVRGTEYVATADQYSNKTTILVNEGTVSVTETKTGST